MLVRATRVQELWVCWYTAKQMIMFHEILYCSIAHWVSTECPLTSSAWCDRIYWCLTLKAIDVWVSDRGKKRNMLVIKERGNEWMSIHRSRKSSPSFSMAEQAKGSYDHTAFFSLLMRRQYCLLSSVLQQHFSVHLDRLGPAVPYGVLQKVEILCWCRRKAILSGI